jgi:hypothetical protein
MCHDLLRVEGTALNLARATGGTSVLTVAPPSYPQVAKSVVRAGSLAATNDGMHFDLTRSRR